MKNVQNLFSNGPKPKGDIIQQLEDLRDWSQNPERYERRLNFRAEQAKKKVIKVAGIKDSALYKTLKDPRVIGLDLGHDTILEIINLIQNSGLVKKPKEQPKKDQVVDKQLIKFALEEPPVPIVKKPEPEPTIPIEEKIRRFAQAKQNNTEQIGVASLLGIPKRFSR